MRTFTARLPLATAPLAVLLSAGCDDSDGSPVDGPPADTPPGDAPPGGERISIRFVPVMAGAAIPSGRFVVVFYQQDDDINVDPAFHIGYDVPYTGQTQTIEVPLDQIELPAPIDDYRFCPRECEDLTDPACDCPPAEVKIAMARAFVITDVNGSGAIEISELEEPNIYGIGYFFLGAADRAYPVPNPLDLMYPEGIVEGLAPYRIIPRQPAAFDQLGIPAPGTVFEVDVCVPGDASCELMRSPNIS